MANTPSKTKTAAETAKPASTETKPAEKTTTTQSSTGDKTTTQPGDQGGSTPVTTQTSTGADNDAAAEAARDAIAPAVAGIEDSPEVQERTRVALGSAGDTPAPTMVNGKSVVGKKFDEASGEWVDDPDAAAAAVRPADIFDRIGEAFPHERQRLVIEEIARAAGLDDSSVDLPDGMPASKSTASLRTDVTGRGRFTGGGVGPAPVEPGVDGKAQVEAPEKGE